ncbi:hypothetical protein CAter282_0130 [Collimonas arenae]|uniref:Insertion element IS402-like domain-containing protein n=1 Tax=Collimonas arenae TaxID=279058 RepID=A0A127QD54_9BURK|nr:transposase [Collimonas arenae]AMO98087.1 hypothetical protein CAter10_0140 [Collimonas arenae]AMP07954.1 hypothetical protein CAter282_0130 [Collimonas arenae]
MPINNDQWQKLKPFLPGGENAPGVTGRDNRLFVNAIFWIVLNEAKWSQLPSGFGQWQTAYMRFRRWNQAGIWRQMADHVDADPALQRMLDAIAAFGDDYAWRLSRRTLIRKNKVAHGSGLPRQPLPPAPDAAKERGKAQNLDTNWIWLLTHK